MSEGSITEQEAEIAFRGKLVGIMARQLVKLDIERFERMVSEAAESIRGSLSAEGTARVEAETSRMRRSLELRLELETARCEGRIAEARRIQRRIRDLLRGPRTPRDRNNITAPADSQKSDQHDKAWSLVEAPDLTEFAARLAQFNLAEECGVNGAPMAFLPLEAKAERSQKLLMVIEAGADPLATQRDGGTILHAFAWQRRRDTDDHKNIVEILLSVGVMIDRRDIFGRTALTQAVAHGAEREIEALLAFGADPNQRFPPDVGHRDYQGKTLLMMAASNWKEFKLLLDHGADPTLTDEDGLTLDEHIRAEITRIDRDLGNPRNSPGLVKSWTRFRNAYQRSLKAITAP